MIAQLLAELGDTADDVADRLRALGIKGERGVGEHCPIANLLHSNGYEGAEVDTDTIYPEGSFGDVEVDAPEPVEEFIRRFDDGVYLDLIVVNPA